MAALISAKTISDWSVFAAKDAEKIVDRFISDGYDIYNYVLKAHLLVEDIRECDWGHWFERIDEDREYGGVLMHHDVHGYTNPIICIGSRGSVELPESRNARGTHVITIHSHPRCEKPEFAMPSTMDWLAGAGNGWHIVVTQWGLFAHYARGRQTRHAQWPEQQLVFIPRCEISGGGGVHGDIGAGLFLENRV